MLLFMLSTLLALGTVKSRDTMKSSKAMPSITNSLVNLGKMDISFHFNTKDTSPRPEPSLMRSDQIHPSNTFSFTKPEHAMDESCPCSAFKNFKEPSFGNPSDIINKILMSNDLFSFNKEPVTSTLCCESHEHMQEDIVTFEFGPKHIDGNARKSVFPPMMFDNLIPQKLISVPSVKPKAVEIFLFPKKKDNLFDNGKFITKKDIKIVGDRELKNNFSNFKIKTFPASTTSTVKKDLANQELDTTKAEEQEYSTTDPSTAGNLNSL